MNASVRIALAGCLITFTATATSANPELFVTYEGVNGANQRWSVAVAPDPDFFSDTTSGFGSSLAVELAFAVDGSSIVNGSVSVNQSDWPADNPGNNPFTNSVTFGTSLGAGLDTAFTAYGSNVFLSGAPVKLFDFQTLGTDLTTIRYGVAASGDPVKGSIIAQSGQNFPAGLAAQATLAIQDLGGAAAGGLSEIHVFSGYTGSVNSVPEPATLVSICIAAGIAWCAPSRKRR
jgi:hypothetical protein